MSMETMIAAAVTSALANATMTWVGGSARVVYDDRYADPLGIASSAPAVQCVSASAATLAQGATVSVTPDRTATAVAYTVREIQADGRGMVRLLLSAT